MTRIASLLFVSLVAWCSSSAFAQSNSELLGGPGYRAAEEEAAKRAAAQRQVEDQIRQARAPKAKQKSDQAAAARQADAQKAEEKARLAQQADDLKAREDQLKSRETKLAAEEDRLAQLRAELEDRRESEDRQETAEIPAEPPILSSEQRPPMRLRASIRSCARAGEDKALSKDYLSAEYVRPPRFFERSAYDGRWELRGVMRIEDWRGYVLADTVCELDAGGYAQRFAFVR